jgi:hypothetical protein
MTVRFQPTVPAIGPGHARWIKAGEPHLKPGDGRPTRQQIIEEAVRLWAKRQEQAEADSIARAHAMKRGTSTPSFP